MDSYRELPTWEALQHALQAFVKEMKAQPDADHPEVDIVVEFSMGVFLIPMEEPSDEEGASCGYLALGSSRWPHTNRGILGFASDYWKEMMD